MARTQQDRILEYLRLNPEGMTQRDAIWLGCYRLAAQVFELKRKGYTITTEMKEVINKDGSTSRIAVYHLHEGENVPRGTIEERQLSVFNPQRPDIRGGREL